jgi:hypothetical protein
MVDRPRVRAWAERSQGREERPTTIPWITPAALATAVVLLVVRSFGSRLFRGAVTWRYAFRCPADRGEVAAEFRESVWDGRRLNVERCSAFRPSEDVRCDKASTVPGRLSYRRASR